MSSRAMSTGERYLRMVPPGEVSRARERIARDARRAAGVTAKVVRVRRLEDWIPGGASNLAIERVPAKLGEHVFYEGVRVQINGYVPEGEAHIEWSDGRTTTVRTPVNEGDC